VVVGLNFLENKYIEFLLEMSCVPVKALLRVHSVPTLQLGLHSRFFGQDTTVL